MDSPDRSADVDGILTVGDEFGARVRRFSGSARLLASALAGPSQTAPEIRSNPLPRAALYAA